MLTCTLVVSPAGGDLNHDPGHDELNVVKVETNPVSAANPKMNC
jgi:hypothetical protein